MRITIVLLLLISPICFAKIKLEKLVKDDWIEVQSSNFTVVTDMKAKNATRLVNDLEQFRYFITVTLGRELATAKPLEILAISSRRNFKRLDLPEFWAGVFLGGIRGNIAIANVSNYRNNAKNKGWGNQVLMHEYVHFAAHGGSNGAVYPLWYNEGVAEYLATFRIEDNGQSVAIGNMDVIGNRLYSIRSRSGTGFEKIDVEDLFKTTNINMSWRRHDSGKEKRKDEKAASKFYARAMITYHYLKSTAELGVQIGKYLSYLNQGKSVDESFSRSFNLTYQEMDDAIDAYLSGRHVKYIKFDIEKAGIDLPSIKPRVKKLNASDMYVYLARSLLRFDSYSIAERDAILQLAQKNNPDSVALQVAGIDYLESAKPTLKLDLSNKDFASLSTAKLKKLIKNNRLLEPLTNKQADMQLAALAVNHPNDANIYSLQAYIRFDWVDNLLKVGHPDASRELSKLRNLARKSINLDYDNGRAFFVLGMAGADSAENRPKFIDEAAESLRIARDLIGVRSVSKYMWKEINLNILLGQSNQVLALSRQYKMLHSNKWITEGYGRFFVEAHEIRTIPFSPVKTVTKGRIDYEDGSSFVGEIKNNVPNGKGILHPYFGGELKGTWRDGFVEGRGELKTSNGFEYTGDFQTGLLTGTGKLLWPDGYDIVKSEGEFLMAMEHGKHQYYKRKGRVFAGDSWLGNYHGELKVMKDGKILKTFNAHLGVIQVPLSENLVFAGKINANNEASGNGTCYDKVANRVWPCIVKDGKILNRSHPKT